MQRMKLLILKYARSSLREEGGCGNGTERLHERELQKERGKLRQRERQKVESRRGNVHWGTSVQRMKYGFHDTN